jgi:Zn-finger protein
MSIVPANCPFATGNCFYCFVQVPCDDAHAERSFGRSWRLRCDACRDAGANHGDDLADKLTRAIRQSR